MKMFLTRIGFGSTAVITGDVTQIDLPRGQKSGLSFPADVDLPDVRIWGDVVICADVVGDEAAIQGKPYDDHFAHMVVHGVLHLLGYDHQTAAEAAVMEQLEVRILDGLAISDPYGEG
jgi:probable rRNA maturation factor